MGVEWCNKAEDLEVQKSPLVTEPMLETENRHESAINENFLTRKWKAKI